MNEFVETKLTRKDDFERNILNTFCRVEFRKNLCRLRQLILNLETFSNIHTATRKTDLDTLGRTNCPTF